MYPISRVFIALGGALLVCQGAMAQQQQAMAGSSMQMSAMQMAPAPGNQNPAPAKQAPQPLSPLEQAFMQANDQAMSTMMNNMAITPSGDVDEDFVAMMTPHHQGAIDMAVAELRYGKNEQLKRIAQEIIVTQQQEITAMYQALGKPLPPDAPAPDQVAPAQGDAVPQ